MTFPVINHINDVLSSIAGRPEFIVAQRDGYTVIDYNFAVAGSFDDSIRLECRGLKFGPDGTILARPLHKFFNIGERPETQPQVLDFGQPHAVTEKLDGSMIHAAVVNGEVVFMTRMGRTDVARRAERHLTNNMKWFFHGNGGRLTFIFEFTAPDNRIVVRYDESTLSLLAIRDTVTGEYISQDWLVRLAGVLDVPLVQHHLSAWENGAAFVDYARAITGREGFVIRFESGLWVKAKGNEYVLKHKAKDSVLQEKNVLALVLRNELDDVLPLLDSADRANVERYRTAVLSGIERVADEVDAIVGRGTGLDQKTFATTHLAPVSTRLRPLAFQVRGGAVSRHAVVAAVLNRCGSQAGVDSIRQLFGANFDMAAANDNSAVGEAAAA